MAAAAAVLSNRANEHSRTFIVTPRIELQSQMRLEMREIAESISGRSNYICDDDEGSYGTVYSPSPVDADGALCSMTGDKYAKICPTNERGGCQFFNARTRARRADIVIGNYQLYMNYSYNPANEMIANVGLLICDEAHLAIGEVDNFASVSITNANLQWMNERHLDPPVPNLYGLQRNTYKKALDEYGMKAWEIWGNWVKDRKVIELINSEISGFSEEFEKTADKDEKNKIQREIKSRKALARKMASMASDDMYVGVISPDRFDWQTGQLMLVPGTSLDFKRVVPDMEPLFGGSDKVLLLSATISTSMIQYMGIEEGDFIYREINSTFPPENTPFRMADGAIDMSAKAQYCGGNTMSQSQYAGRFHESVTKLLDAHQDDKAIIVSHANKYISHRVWGYYNNAPGSVLDRGVFSPNGTKELRETLPDFRKTSKPSILMSASIGIGYDFPDDDSRLVIIPAIPYMDMGDLLVKARMEMYGWSWYNLWAANSVAQASGRATRSQDDYSEVFIMDSRWDKFYKMNRRYFPRWFQERIDVPRHPFHPMQQPLNIPGEFIPPPPPGFD